MEYLDMIKVYLESEADLDIGTYFLECYVNYQGYRQAVDAAWPAPVEAKV